jgi:hypothetical protein
MQTGYLAALVLTFLVLAVLGLIGLARLFRSE